MMTVGRKLRLGAAVMAMSLLLTVAPSTFAQTAEEPASTEPEIQMQAQAEEGKQQDRQHRYHRHWRKKGSFPRGHRGPWGFRDGQGRWHGRGPWHGRWHGPGFPGRFPMMGPSLDQLADSEIMTPELEGALNRWKEARQQVVEAGREAAKAWRAAAEARMNVMEAWLEAARDAGKITQEQYERMRARHQQWKTHLEKGARRAGEDPATPSPDGE